MTIKMTNKMTNKVPNAPANDSGKVGSDPAAAKHFAGGGDFGIPAEGAGRFTEVAEEAKYQPGGDHLSDPRPERSGSSGSRTSGVGGIESGPGSSSGGDLDTDFVGVGTHGRGISAAGPDDRAEGADMVSDGNVGDRSLRGSASAKPASGKMRGTTVDRSGGEAATTSSGFGSGSASSMNSAGGDVMGDDAAAGEISQGEAAGDDNTDVDNLS